jgi:hypothetical protein
LVRDAYRAFNEGDIDGFLGAFTEDAVLHGGDGQIEEGMQSGRWSSSYEL